MFNRITAIHIMSHVFVSNIYILGICNSLCLFFASNIQIRVPRSVRSSMKRNEDEIEVDIVTETKGTEELKGPLICRIYYQIKNPTAGIHCLLPEKLYPKRAPRNSNTNRFKFEYVI